jgi:hypothetical protein
LLDECESVGIAVVVYMKQHLVSTEELQVRLASLQITTSSGRDDDTESGVALALVGMCLMLFISLVFVHQSP